MALHTLRELPPRTLQLHTPIRSPGSFRIAVRPVTIRLASRPSRSSLTLHPAGVAPFSLITYTDALPYLAAIKADVISRKMPEVRVRLETGCTDATTFTGQRRLLKSEIDTISQWVDAGGPEGNPADLPTPLTFKDGKWLGGDPDMVLPNDPKGFDVPANVNRDIFRNFVIPTNFTEDRYITQLEVLPGIDTSGGKSLVHHVLIELDPNGDGLKQLADFQKSNPAVPGPGYESVTGAGFPAPLLGSWFPGSDPLYLPEGVGIKIPKGAYIVLQVHYGGETHFLTEAAHDQTLLGIKFARTPIYKERTTMLCRNETFRIPAGDPHYMVIADRVSPSEVPPTKAGLTLQDDVVVDSLTPHQHRLATDFLAEAILPNGQTQCLIDVDWDTTHQGTYFYQKPLHLPAGTQIKVTGFYNN